MEYATDPIRVFGSACMLKKSIRSENAFDSFVKSVIRWKPFVCGKTPQNPANLNHLQHF